MKPRKDRQIIIQAAIVMAFIFGIIVAYIAYNTGSFLMGLIFLTTLQIIILLAILYMLERVMELFERKK